MLPIQKQYIVDEQNNKVAVQLNIKDFEEIENLLEDHALLQLMNANNEEDNDLLSLEEGKAYYQTLAKNGEG